MQDVAEMYADEIFVFASADGSDGQVITSGQTDPRPKGPQGATGFDVSFSGDVITISSSGDLGNSGNWQVQVEFDRAIDDFSSLMFGFLDSEWSGSTTLSLQDMSVGQDYSYRFENGLTVSLGLNASEGYSASFSIEWYF